MMGFLIIMALLGFPFLGIALYLGFSVFVIILGLAVAAAVAGLLANIFFPTKPRP